MNHELDTKMPMLVKTPIKNGKNTKQYLAAVTVSMGAFSVGTVLSWTSIALPYLKPPPQALKESNFTESFQKHNSVFNFQVNENEEAWIGAILTIGALISAIPSGYLADRIGRKKTLLVLAVPLLINWMFIAYASSAGILLFARFMAGIAVGGVCAVAPIYISEIAEKTSRGTFASFFQLFLCSGIMFTSVIGTFTSWLGLSLVLGLVPVLFFGIFYFMPETPLYLLKKNKIFESEVTLRSLRDNQSDIMEEFNVMHQELIEAKGNAVTIKEVLKNRCYIRAITTIIGIMVFQQFSGINAIIFYTVPIFNAAKSTLPPDVAAIMINLVQVLVSYISTLVIEKADRKIYLLLSAVGMFICLSSLGIFFHFKSIEVQLSGLLCAIPIASTILFMASFAIGFGPIPWMLIGELPAPEIKGIASGIAIVASWLCAFLVTFCFPLLNVAIGIHNTFYIFSGFVGVSIGFIHLVVPETRGITFLEIQKKLCT